MAAWGQLVPGLWLLDLYPQSAPYFSSSCQLCTPTPTPNPPKAPHWSGFLHMCGYVATCALKIGRQLALHSLWLWYAMCPQEDRSREDTTWAGKPRFSVTKRMFQGKCRLWWASAIAPWSYPMGRQAVGEGLKWRPLHWGVQNPGWGCILHGLLNQDGEA